MSEDQQRPDDETVAEQIQRSLTDGYIKAFKVVEPNPTFTIYWPRGEPILCRKPRRFGAIGQATREAIIWWNQIIKNPELRLEDPKMADLIEEITSSGGELTADEMTAGFFIRHFPIDPVITDLQAVELILCPALLSSLYSQINRQLNAMEEAAQTDEVEDQKKGSGQTAGTT